MGGALSDYRIIDLTDEKGVFCSHLLADMGAEVIRIVSPHAGEDELSYCYQNLGKKSITLDLQAAEGRRLFRKLVACADALVESYRRGYLGGMALGYPELSEINPALVMTSITGFGQSGPYRDYEWNDLTMAAMGGYMHMCGEADTPPLKPYGSQSYYITALFAAFGTVLAIRQRHDTGEGQHVDISALECVAATLDHALPHYLCEGVVAKRQGSLSWNSAFRLFLCKDGHVLLSFFQQWDTLVALLDSEGMADDLTEERWHDPGERRRNASHIIEVLEKWTASHEADELVETGQLMRFPWSEVVPVSRLLNSPQLAARDFFMDVLCPGSDGPVKCPGAPVKMSRSPWQTGGKAPWPGEHNMVVYNGLLGFSASSIEDMHREGVV
jgi:crotonobetainyl-CoA:carnitine CoA-transferase CaiB-like acyl-CoA transferase